MKKNLFKLLAALALVQGVVQAKEIEVFYAVNPPLMCVENGELACLAGTLLKNAAKAGGYTLKHSLVPWAAAVDALDKNPNAVFAATGRTGFSEKSANWLFQVYSDDVNIWTLDAKKITGDADITKLGKIVIRRGSPFGDYLKNKGVGDHVLEVAEWPMGVQMLDGGRADAMCLSTAIGRTNFIKIGKIPEARVNRFPIGKIGWYLVTAANKPVNPDVTAFKALLEVEKAKPAFQEQLKTLGVQN